MHFYIAAVDVGCDNLPPILNGNVALEGTSTGDTATYSCNSGFTLDGNSVRSCLPNGQWSGQEPSCVGKCLFIYCKCIYHKQYEDGIYAGILIAFIGQIKSWEFSL